MSKIIVLDPGHGGTTTVGGSSPNNATSFSGVLEKTMTLDMAKRIRLALNAQAPEVEVILTRVTDVNVGITDRAQVSANQQADLFLSIHFNATIGARGVETWIRGIGRGNINFAADRAFAQKIQAAMVSAIRVHDAATPDRGVKSDDDRAQGIGVLNDVSLGNTNGAIHLSRACLAEIEFIDHPAVDRLFNTGPNMEAVRDGVACAIASALLTELDVAFSPAAVLAAAAPNDGPAPTVENAANNMAIPLPDTIRLRSAGMKGDPVMEAVADGHMILRATGGAVAGIGLVQDGLNQLGFSIDLGTGKKFRGFFGDKTKGAVRAFQEATPGIDETTGMVDQETILALDAALAKPPVILQPLPGEPLPLIAKGQVVATLKEKPGGAGALRDVKIFKLAGRNGYYYNAAMAIDVDGSPRAYSAGADHPTPLDGPGSVDAEGFATMYIQQRVKTVHGKTHLGEGPFKDFFVSRTSLFFDKDEAFKTSNFVDAELIPFVVFPDTPAKFPGTQIGDMAYVIDLKTKRSTHAIFADTNPKVGEASLRVAQNLGRSNLNAGNGDEEDRYVYIVFPGTKFTPLETVPHWPDEKIKEEADKAFTAWGGMAQAEKLFG